MGKIAFFRENLLSLRFFLWGTMPHSTLSMIAVVKHSVSFYQPFFSDVNSWGWPLLLLTVSHTRIRWLQLGFGELALQGMLSWPFLFIWPAAFVSNLPLAKGAGLKRIHADHSSHPDVPSVCVCVGLYHLCSGPPSHFITQHFLFRHVWINLIWSEPFSAYPDNC